MSPGTKPLSRYEPNRNLTHIPGFSGPFEFNERRRWWHDCPHVYRTHVFPFMFFWNIFPLIFAAICRMGLSTRFSWVDDFPPFEQKGPIKLWQNRIPHVINYGFYVFIGSSIRSAGSTICCSYIIAQLQPSCSSFSKPFCCISDRELSTVSNCPLFGPKYFEARAAVNCLWCGHKWSAFTLSLGQKISTPWNYVYKPVCLIVISIILPILAAFCITLTAGLFSHFHKSFRPAIEPFHRFLPVWHSNVFIPENVSNIFIRAGVLSGETQNSDFFPNQNSIGSKKQL